MGVQHTIRNIWRRLAGCCTSYILAVHADHQVLRDSLSISVDAAKKVLNKSAESIDAFPIFCFNSNDY